jgi:hypothetical protein
MRGKPSQLHLKSKRRNGERFSDGTLRTERRYLDFVIDRTSLSEIVSSAAYDSVSVFTKERGPESGKKSLRRPRVRAVPALLESWEEAFLVRDFGCENDHQQGLHVHGLKISGPYRFESRAYKGRLAAAMLPLTP